MIKYNWDKYNIIRNNILSSIYATGDKQAWYNFLKLQDKKTNEGYVTARHYLDNYLDNVEGSVMKEGYNLYKIWCENDQLPVLSQKKFTVFARDRYKLFITHKWINNKYERLYIKLDACPTCDRAFRVVDNS